MKKRSRAVLDYGHKCITIEHAKRIASEVCKIHEEEEFVDGAQLFARSENFNTF